MDRAKRARRGDATAGFRRRRWPARAVALAAAGLLLALEVAAADPEPPRPNATVVEAAALRHLAHFVTWPPEAFAAENSPWLVGVLGPDPFGPILERALHDRIEQGRPFEAHRAETLPELPPCQILFVGYRDAAKRRAALAALKGRPVLTVGDTPDFLLEGGIVRFQVSNRVEISVNLDQARMASLKIQTKLLEVAREIVENGATRRLR